MKRLTREEASQIAYEYGFLLSVDFHAFPTATVDKIIAAANARGYRKPKNANGSRARYFYAYLNRVYNRNE